MSKPRRHHFRDTRFTIGSDKAEQWCVDCGCVKRARTYKTERVYDAYWEREVQRIVLDYRIGDIATYYGADAIYCWATRAQRRRHRRQARR